MGALRPGQMLEGTSYQVVRELGAGGMGVVYEIEHVRLKKQYVAKVILDQIKDEDSATKRMEREAQVLAAISHPNVVQVHDVGTTPDGTSYFVMEKLEGVDLRQTMKQGGVPRIRSIEIVSDVLEALAYVHRRGIVHRDIKPENIFLAQQPHGKVTKVLDFGIVHIFDSDGHISQGRITKTGGFIGTLYYAAPEQMQGKPAGPPNDVYAAGLVLFELLAGKGPFDDDPGVGLSRCFKPAPLLTDFVPTAPRELAAILARALEQEPSARPTAGALAADLRTIAAALKVQPGNAEDDAVRAEVDDLLRHMTPGDQDESRTPAPRLVSDGAAVATPAPATPPLGAMPGGGPVAPRMLEATMASPTGEPTPPPAAPALPAGEPMPSPAVPASAPPHGADAIIHDARRVHTPAPLGATATLLGPGRSSPGFVPVDTAASTEAAPSPRTVGITHVHPARFGDSVPGAPAVTGDVSTSPGLYATIDNSSVASTRTPPRTPWTALVVAGALVVLGLVVGVGWFATRQHGASTATATALTVTTAARASAKAVTSEPSSTAGAPEAATTPTAAAAAAAPSTPSSALGKVAPPTSIASATKPPARPATVAPLKTVAPSAPRASAKPNVDTDGYVKSL